MMNVVSSNGCVSFSGAPCCAVVHVSVEAEMHIAVHQSSMYYIGTAFTRFSIVSDPHNQKCNEKILQR